MTNQRIADHIDTCIMRLRDVRHETLMGYPDLDMVTVALSSLLDIEVYLYDLAREVRHDSN